MRSPTDAAGSWADNHPRRDDPYWERHYDRLMSKLEREAIEDAERKSRLAAEHRYECQQAFSRPPKKAGHGQPPMKKWGPRKR